MVTSQTGHGQSREVCHTFFASVFSMDDRPRGCQCPVRMTNPQLVHLSWSQLALALLDMEEASGGKLNTCTILDEKQASYATSLKLVPQPALEL